MGAVSAHPGFGSIALLMVLTGIGIPVMAALNSGLAQQLGSPVAATTLLFAIALVLCAGIMVATGSVPEAGQFTVDRPHLYAGAVFVVFYALSITWAAPRIGVGNAVFFVLLGQLVAAAAIDHFGLLGALRTALTWRRIAGIAGIAVMALGVYLARKPV